MFFCVAFQPKKFSLRARDHLRASPKAAAAVRHRRPPLLNCPCCLHPSPGIRNSRANLASRAVVCRSVPCDPAFNRLRRRRAPASSSRSLARSSRRQSYILGVPLVAALHRAVSVAGVGATEGAAHGSGCGATTEWGWWRWRLLSRVDDHSFGLAQSRSWSRWREQIFTWFFFNEHAARQSVKLLCGGEHQGCSVRWPGATALWPLGLHDPYVSHFTGNQVSGGCGAG